MGLSRDLSKLICRALIGVFLFAQLAVASYACPQLTQLPTRATVVQADGPGAMPGCHQMDRSAANLCAEHCHFGHQSSDTAPAPAAIAPAPALLYIVPADGAEAGEAANALPSGPLLAAGMTRHAILHCVLRI